jgi:glycine/D-amino acid oxidase-like deaminating enzyme
LTISHWQDRARAEERAVDVAVVGGGVLGCATAFWLSEVAPERRIAILEAKRLGAGGSGRNAGFVLPILSTDYDADRRRYGARRARKLLQFVMESCRLVGERLGGGAFAYRQSGGLVAAGSAEEAGRLRESVASLRADGLPVAYLTAEAVNDRIVGQNYHGALYVPSAGALNPLAFTKHLAAASEATLLEHHRVLRIEGQPDGGSVLHTPRRKVRARQTVVTVGADLSRLFPSLKRFSQPTRAQMLATEPASETWLGVPVYSHDGNFYVRQLPGGVLLAGGARHRHRDEETGREDRTTPAVQNEVERYLRDHFPQARSLSVRRRWSGAMSFSPDRAPVLGRLPGSSDGFWAAGCTGHGLSFCMGLGRLLARGVAGTRTTDDVSLFSADRFSEKAA